MAEGSLGLLVEMLVCILLVATIFYCISVNRKLERLRSEQKGMQSFIRELSQATANADKAIQGLRQTVEASGNELAQQIEKGRSTMRQLKTEIEKAEQSMNRLVVLAGGAGRLADLEPIEQEQEVEESVTGQSIEDLRRRMIGFDDLEDLTADSVAERVRPQGRRAGR